jgi:hypothetical protein
VRAEDVPPYGGLSGIAAAAARLGRRGEGLAALAETVAKLPAEMRVGAEAAETMAATVPRIGDPVPAYLTGQIGGGPLSMPVRVDKDLPVNVWIVVDGNGRAMNAGVLNPRDEGATE